MQSTELTYRRSAAEGAGGFGLLIALYDTLAGNLLRAANAERRNDIERRCLEVNHALLVVGYLEDCTKRCSGGELTKKLAAFYSSLRRQLIEAQVKRAPEILEEQMQIVLSIRETWQKMELAGSHSQDAPVAVEELDQTIPAPASPSSMSWSA